jgi:hypothetical protein
MSGFSVTEDINSDDDYASEEESEQEESNEEISDDEQPKKLKILQTDAAPVENKPAKFIKPLDYQQLKQEQDQHGVIFVEKPMNVDLIERFKNEKALQRYLQEFGAITRVKAAFEVRKRKRYLTGFYVEFDKKSVAKRVALTLNGAPICKPYNEAANIT